MSAVKSVSSFRLASILRRENDPSAAMKLFRNPDPESTNPKRPFRYSLLCYDIIITKLGGSKMFDELDQVLLQLKTDTRIVPTEIIFCNVINFFGRGKLPSRALHMFDEMPQYRCQRTVKSLNSLLNALLKCGELEKMKERLSSIDEFGKPDACTYNILIHGCSQSGCFDDALKLFDEMVKKKVKPTGVTFGTLIHGLCKDSRVKEALKMKHDMLKVYGVRPTVHIYASLIKALCQIGELSFAFKLKDEAYEGKIKVDAAIYSTLISSLIKAGRSNEKWEEATYLFEDMPRRGCSPDTLSYRIVFDGLCEGLQFEEAAVILDEMLFKGYKPRRDRLEGFLQKLCESGQLEILSKVTSSLHRGNAGDADVWSVMIPTMCIEPVISDSIDLLLNTVKEDGPLSAMPQC
ncbi:unnamed protein product [Arabidopsis thaliana]|uniref:(thale cress) hypothetical protein n=1 Tax=Arabidopsis thaliana TaxID=3702 RepID=A0A7G2E0D2_ARATH|nr:unnamed protein product [Arabidopsis thaliana]